MGHAHRRPYKSRLIGGVDRGVRLRVPTRDQALECAEKAARIKEKRAQADLPGGEIRAVLKRIWLIATSLVANRRTAPTRVSMTPARIWRWADRTRGSNDAQNTSNRNR